MKCFFIANSEWYLSNFRASTLREFSRISEVVCLFPRGSGDGSLDAMPAVKSPFRLNPVSLNPVSEILGLLSFLWVAVRDRPDLFFSFNPKTNLYSLIVAWLLRVPCIPNVSGVGVASQLTGWKGKVYKGVASFFYRRAAHVLFQNPDDLASFIKDGWVRPDRASLIPGSGVNLDLFVPVPRKDRKFTFLLAARLIKNKGIVEYLTAARSVAGSVPGCDFLLAGVPDRSDRAIDARLLDNLCDHPNIHFLGHVRDMPRLLAEVDCVVLPSYYPEGIPKSLIEAASSGKVIITTDTPGCREVIDGNGLLIEPGSAASLAQAMQSILEKKENELSAMRLASRSLAENRFDEKIVIGRYVDLAKSHC